MTSQSQIAIESHAGKLLRMMVQFGHCPCERITPAVKWLIKRQFAYRSYGKLYITEPNPRAKTAGTSGREYYEGLCKNPSSMVNIAAWLAEVRSGLSVISGPLGTVTRQSKITRAVIPGIVTSHSHKTPEDIMDENSERIAAQNYWCTMLEISHDELRELGRADRIKTCNNCGQPGVFDKPQERTRKMCRKCLKKRKGK